LFTAVDSEFGDIGDSFFIRSAVSLQDIISSASMLTSLEAVAFASTKEALAYFARGHAKGKIVVKIHD
jgi:hypothetical protein